MKKIFTIVLIFSCLQSQAQEKHWYHVTGNDAAIMSLELGAGYVQGWREQVLYHPNELFRQFPHLNRNFWDNRISWQNKKKFAGMQDANHAAKLLITSLHVAAVVIKVGDLKTYKKQDRWKKIVFDFAKYYMAYKAGFFLSYNVTHHNKL